MDLPWLSSDETVTAWSRMSEERVEGVALCIQAARLESREKGNASMANSVQQSGDGAKKGKLAVLFEDLSIAQVIAGALAAATVFLLSSVIGVAGSLIGAAVGSIVSAVSSQVYKKMLSASADKIRDVAPDGASANQADPNETRLMEPVSSSETRVIDSNKIAASATKVMGADDIRYQSHASSDKAVDPALQRAHVRRRRKARVQRSVIIVSIVSALIAIVVSAGRSVTIRSHQSMCAVVDGRERIELLPQTAVTVRKSDKAARFVSFGEHEFFEILSHKLLQRG